MIKIDGDATSNPDDDAEVEARIVEEEEEKADIQFLKLYAQGLGWELKLAPGKKRWHKMTQ